MSNSTRPENTSSLETFRIYVPYNFYCVTMDHEYANLFVHHKSHTTLEAPTYTFR